MIAFFMISIVGGILKFLIALLKDEVETLDVVALAYGVLVFVLMAFYYLDTGIDVLDF